MLTWKIFVETVTYIAIINSPNRRYNPPPAVHCPPNTYPLMCHSLYYSTATKVGQNLAVLAVNLAWLQSMTIKPWYLKLVILKIPSANVIIQFVL